MTFGEALEHLKVGKKVRRRGWTCETGYIDSEKSHASINVQDVLSHDWELYTDPEHEVRLAWLREVLNRLNTQWSTNAYYLQNIWTEANK